MQSHIGRHITNRLPKIPLSPITDKSRKKAAPKDPLHGYQYLNFLWATKKSSPTPYVDHPYPFFWHVGNSAARAPSPAPLTIHHLSAQYSIAGPPSATQLSWPRHRSHVHYCHIVLLHCRFWSPPLPLIAYVVFVCYHRRSPVPVSSRSCAAWVDLMSQSTHTELVRHGRLELMRCPGDVGSSGMFSATCLPFQSPRVAFSYPIGILVGTRKVFQFVFLGEVFEKIAKQYFPFLFDS